MQFVVCHAIAVGGIFLPVLFAAAIAHDFG